MTVIISAGGTPIAMKQEGCIGILALPPKHLRKSELLFSCLQSNICSVCLGGCRAENKIAYMKVHVYLSTRILECWK